ncbi:MAG: hypothetical protein ABI550_06255 [Ignavibacteriaceae bacterium]
MSSQKKILIEYKFFSIFLLLIIVINITLLFFPLTNVFGYEFSLFNSILLSLLSGLYTLIVLKLSGGKIENKKHLIKILIISFTLFLFFPFIISIIHSLLTISCSLYDGFLFYLIITVPSVIIGCSLAFAVKVFTKKYQVFIFILIYISILLIPAFEFYFNPQIFFYNPIFAFFPGTIYDEGLSVDLKLFIYRFLNIIFFGGLLILSINLYYNISRFSKKTIFVLSILTAILFIYFSPSFGYSTTFNRMTNNLKGTIETPHFKIHYSEDINENLIKAIALHHEYYYNELIAFFNLKMDEKINTFIFKDDLQKKELLGTANADIAKPWLKQCYIVYENYNVTLRHEIAHVFSGEFGNGILKIAENFNPSLIEGAAVAADPFYAENDIHYMAALAYNNKFKVNIENLFSSYSFLTQASSLSYIYSGSFCKFLIDEYGIEKFKKLYGEINFQTIYKTSLAELSKKYYDFLSKIKAENINSAHYFFGRQSIFSKVCPRFIADRLSIGWEYYSNKNYDKSKKTFEEILKVSNNYSALIGLSNSLNELGKSKEAISLLENNINNFKNTAYYFNLEFQLADLISEKNDYNKSAKIYETLINEKPNRTIYYLANLRSQILMQDSLLSLYLKSDELNKYLILKELNRISYNYNLFPVLVDLSRSLKENYKIFLDQFNKTLIVDDYKSSYAVYKLSLFMIENLDFVKARKMAALSLRYSLDKSFNKLGKENYKRCTWLFFNSQNYLVKFTYNQN